MFPVWFSNTLDCVVVIIKTCIVKHIYKIQILQTDEYYTRVE